MSLAPVHAAWEAAQAVQPTGAFEGNVAPDGAWEQLYATARCIVCRQWQGPFLSMGAASDWLVAHVHGHHRPWRPYWQYGVFGIWHALWPPWTHGDPLHPQSEWIGGQGARAEHDRRQHTLEAFE